MEEAAQVNGKESFNASYVWDSKEKFRASDLAKFILKFAIYEYLPLSKQSFNFQLNGAFIGRTSTSNTIGAWSEIAICPISVLMTCDRSPCFMKNMSILEYEA